MGVAIRPLPCRPAGIPPLTPWRAASSASCWKSRRVIRNMHRLSNGRRFPSLPILPWCWSRLCHGVMHSLKSRSSTGIAPQSDGPDPARIRLDTPTGMQGFKLPIALRHNRGVYYRGAIRRLQWLLAGQSLSLHGHDITRLLRAMPTDVADTGPAMIGKLVAVELERVCADGE